MKEAYLNKVKKILTSSETYFCLMLAVLMGIVLFSPNIAGVADNGDFNRVLRPSLMWYKHGLSHAQTYFNYVMEQYDILVPLPLPIPTYLNTHLPVVMLAKTVNVLLFSREIFYIRVLGGVYCCLMLWASFLIMRGIKTKHLWLNILLFALYVFIFGDSGHLLYFNSLFAEPTAFVFFLLAVGYLLQIVRAEKVKLHMAVLFFTALLLFLGAKVQYALLSVLFVPVAYYIAREFRQKRERYAVWAMLATVVVTSMSLYLMQPAYLDEVTTFDSVFCGIAGNPETAGDRLEELGLPREYEALAGMDGFQAEYPIDIHSQEFRENFYEKIGKGTLVKFYLTHFDLLWEQMERTGREAYYNRPEYLGNRAESFSAERTHYTAFSAYQSVKNQAFPRNVWFILSFFVIYFVVLVAGFFRNKDRRGRILRLFFMILIVFCGIQFVLPAVGNGGIDIAKQLYMFNVIFDFLLMYAIYCAAQAVCMIYRKWKQSRRGVTDK